MSSNFFNELKEWSEIKHRLLEKYLQPYCYKLGSWNNELFYIDGFAGPGTYKKDKRKGSPLIAIEWAKQFYEEERKFSLKCIFVEYDKTYYKELKNHTIELENVGLVYPFHGKFEDKIREILNIIKKSPAFFFIDPFGLAPIKFDILKPIFEREAITELLINFSIKGLQRLAGNLDAHTITKRAQKSARTKVDVLSQVLNTEKWIDIWYWEPRQVARDRKILRLYEENLGKHFDYTFSYPIRTNLKEKPKYYLIFASNHIDAVLLMNDFIYVEEERLKSHTHDIMGMEDLFEIQEKEQLFQEVKNEIHCLGTSSKQITLKSIRQELIPRRFGKLKKKEYDHAVRELDKEGYINRQSNKAIKDDEILEF